MSKVTALKPGTTEVTATIRAPDIRTAIFQIIGTAPLVQHRFSQKAATMMREKQAAGSVAKKGSKKPPRDFEADYHESYYRSVEGWYGMPVGAFRSALIRACSLVDFKMTLARVSIFVEADGYDKDGVTQLVRIDGEPQKLEQCLRNDNGGADIRVRTMFQKWGLTLRVKFDADQFTVTDVANLLARVGLQVGVGESMGNGCGWGTFELVTQ